MLMLMWASDQLQEIACIQNPVFKLKEIKNKGRLVNDEHTWDMPIFFFYQKNPCLNPKLKYFR